MKKHLYILMALMFLAAISCSMTSNEKATEAADTTTVKQQPTAVNNEKRTQVELKTSMGDIVV